MQIVVEPTSPEVPSRDCASKPARSKTLPHTPHAGWELYSGTGRNLASSRCSSPYRAGAAGETAASAPPRRPRREPGRPDMPGQSLTRPVRSTTATDRVGPAVA